MKYIGRARCKVQPERLLLLRDLVEAVINKSLTYVAVLGSFSLVSLG